MKLGFQYGTKYIEFLVEYRKRKTLAIEVEPTGEIIVIAPVDLTEEEVLKIVRSKATWIVQKLYEAKQVNVNKINREAVSGESYMYLGRNYTLQLILDEALKDIEVKLFRGKFVVNTYTKDEDKIKEALEIWYRAKTLEKVNERIAYYQRYFNKKPNSIKVKEQKKRWGSCTANNELLFNWRCSMAKSTALDYIIAHEMCHMYHKDHSQDFWNLLGSVLPDYEVRKEWLKVYGVRLDL